MMQKTVPNIQLNPCTYAKKCDIVFMRNDANPYVTSNRSLEDIKDDCVVYCWNTYIPQLFQYLENTNIKNITLLTGDNDHSCNSNGCIGNFPMDNGRYHIPPIPKNIKKWYAQNAEVYNNKLIPMPIGLAPPWRHDVYLETASIKDKFLEIDRTELLYSNFNTTTNPLRVLIKNIIFKNCKIDTEYNDLSNYYKNLQKHKFVICPPGNGKDTHRVWECLYFGAIPIVEDNPMNRYFSSLFPILVVESWHDINNEFLENEFEKFNINKTWRYDLLDIDNWFQFNDIKCLKDVK